MLLLMYLTTGIVILWLSSALASFVNKKTNSGFLSAATWFGSAYLLVELALALSKNMS